MKRVGFAEAILALAKKALNEDEIELSLCLGVLVKSCFNRQMLSVVYNLLTVTSSEGFDDFVRREDMLKNELDEIDLNHKGALDIIKRFEKTLH